MLHIYIYIYIYDISRLRVKLRRLEFYAKQFEEINAISIGQKVIRSDRLREMNFEVV